MKEEDMNHTIPLRSSQNNSSSSEVLSAREDNVTEANTSKSETLTDKNNNNNNNNKDCGRERLKKHREEVAGNVLIPDTWGQEDLLKDWTDCSSFDKLLAPDGVASARQALVATTTSNSHCHQHIRSS